jgi:hypothetical protein
MPWSRRKPTACCRARSRNDALEQLALRFGAFASTSLLHEFNSHYRGTRALPDAAFPARWMS